jgi:hypothetical protein
MINETEIRREELRAICRGLHVRQLDLLGAGACGDFEAERR